MVVAIIGLLIASGILLLHVRTIRSERNLRREDQDARIGKRRCNRRVLQRGLRFLPQAQEPEATLENGPILCRGVLYRDWDIIDISHSLLSTDILLSS